MKMLHKHLFTKNLFPNCNGDDSDIVINILRELDIETKDIAGELYDTVSFSTVIPSMTMDFIIHELTKLH